MNATKEHKERQDYSILITDDDDRCREALRDIMEPEGFHTLLASSGEEALDIVRGGVVHLVLLDMHMPTLTGLETLQLARQINAMLPAILMTARLQPESHAPGHPGARLQRHPQAGRQERRAVHRGPGAGPLLWHRSRPRRRTKRFPPEGAPRHEGRTAE